MTAPMDSWALARLAIQVMQIDPFGSGGVCVRMRASPDRDDILSVLQNALPQTMRLHPSMSDDELLGGIDLGATLQSKQVVVKQGLLQGYRGFILSMAERCTPDFAARVCARMDTGTPVFLIALDEGAEDSERLPPALLDRLAFQIAPEGRKPEGWSVPHRKARDVTRVRVSDATLGDLVHLANAFGIDSLRAPLLALRTARAVAAVRGSPTAEHEDILSAAALVYGHRATRVPETDRPDEAREDTTPPDQDQPEATGSSDTLPEGDMLIEAVKALLPPNLLDTLVPAGTQRSAAGSGAGAQRTSNRKGRPLPSRPGRMDGRTRIDLVATLRAAVPWQPLRKAATPSREGVVVQISDLHLKRFAQHSDRVLIFCVDASGSAAMSRLNEAKGAIEMLLADAYAKRDHVALIAFRGEGADQLLAPTRSLVQTKRQLADLPGGGATPLASGLMAALQTALSGKTKGLTPSLILLTDGRANIALDGSVDRTAAQTDAEGLCKRIEAEGVQSVVIDTSKRPNGAPQALSAHLGARYVAMPRANATGLAEAVTGALSG